MAQDFFAFSATLNTGSTPSAPQVINLTMPPRIVTGVEVLVPPGPSGVVGFALGAAGQAVIPYNANGWIITDDEKLAWDLKVPMTSGAWQLIGYNTGYWPHTLNVRFLCDLLPIITPDAPSALDPSAIESATLLT